MLLWLYQYLHQGSKWLYFPAECCVTNHRCSWFGSINEPFNLEQKKDLFSTGLGRVSLLQSMAQLYLLCSQDDLSESETTSSLMLFHFPFPHFFFLSAPAEIIFQICENSTESVSSGSTSPSFMSSSFTTIETFLRGRADFISGDRNYMNCSVRWEEGQEGLQKMILVILTECEIISKLL